MRGSAAALLAMTSEKVQALAPLASDARFSGVPVYPTTGKPRKRVATSKAERASTSIINTTPTRSAVQLLDKHEVLAIAGTSYVTLWSWMRAGKFPRGRIVGGKTKWRSDEIQCWLDDLPVRKLKGDPAAAVAEVTA
jgi:predicted DNA-binding transcriptional regulator AlpA